MPYGDQIGDPSEMLSAWALDRTESSVRSSSLAIATWLATALLADRMRAAGYRGPFELVIRRITYSGFAGKGEVRDAARR